MCVREMADEGGEEDASRREEEVGMHQVHQEEQGEIMVHAKDNGENESKGESKGESKEGEG